ncbi:ferric-chelate reductase (NADPH) [Caballeronia udeis]|jgi:ferric-chelate reductase (NADPH)|uniref:Ferric-chelate reductase (NADPH) n=1 Tax=Caballeronia udeis TaxID=1232866 RepID=A0ABW8MT24_9BURK
MDSLSTGAIADEPGLKKPGRLTALLIKWLFRQATVSGVESLSEHFRLVTLAGEDLKAVAWVPGQKIQVDVGGGKNRTYTPVSWNAATGETRILAFSHGDGPGAMWASTARIGKACSFFGPRRSLDLDGLTNQRSLVFGDETAFGLALALGSNLGPSGAIASVFEVSCVEESERVWQAISAKPARFVPRASGNSDAHLDEVEAHLLKVIDEWRPDSFVLSGKASSIQRVRRVLKASGIEAARIRTKAYWAPGKTGLD